VIGGALIGSAAALWVANGRIAGISGILGGFGSVTRCDRDWRLAFLAGLVVAPLLYAFAVRAPAMAIGIGIRLGGELVLRIAPCCVAQSGKRAIRVHATRLRCKIEIEARDPQFLSTVRDRGTVSKPET
jgi:hypothetical protein